MRAFCLPIVLCVCLSSVLGGDNWPQFRGPAGNGHTDSTGLPTTWSETQNVVWKTPIHGRGWSSPVVWGEQVWLTTATPDGRQMYAVCVDKGSGKVVHDVLVFENERPDKINAFNSYASPTPAIEAGRVYVHFGKFGTACLDTASGRILWQRRDLPCDHFAGPGSSVLLLGGMLILTMDGMDVQYLTALDKADGKTLWRTDRTTDFRGVDGDNRKAFSTPAVMEQGGRRYLVSAGAGAAMAYQIEDGKEIWKVRYKGGFSNSSQPMQAGGLALVNTGFGAARLWAVALDSQGDVTEQVKWKIEQDVPLRSSPVIVGERGYMVSDGGVLTGFETASGKPLFRKRLGGGAFSASPITDGKRIWLLDEKGSGTVIQADAEYNEVALNKLPDGCMGSPAVSGKALLIRTKSALYRIEAKGE